MKSIKQQYIDLTEGKMSQFNFMRNLRMTMPQYVTNVTSFKDAVRILKNKSILSESYEGNDTWIDRFNDELGNMDLSFEEEDKALEAIDKLGSTRLIDMYGMLQFPYAVNAFLGDVDEILSSDETLSEAKKTKLTADQVNNDELRMGIRVEMEHTDDVEKAKKIALDHLAENPFYYTQLKLSGVDTKAIPSKEKQAIEKKKDETEFVDKANQMKPVKGVEKVKASANKAHKETNKPVKGVSSMSLVSKSTRGVKKMDATGEKMKKIKENLESMYDAAEELAKQMGDYDSAVVALQDEMGLDSRTADQIASQVYPGTSVPQRVFAKNANISKGLRRIAGIEEEKLREAIRKMIRQETFDGRDNLTDVTGENY